MTPNNDPTLDARGRTQTSDTGGLSTATGYQENFDVGGGERLAVENIDRSGFWHNNRKHAEERAHSYDHQVASNLQRIAELALSNAVSLANLVSTNAAVVTNRQNNDGAAHADRQKTLADRHADLAASNQFRHADLAADAQWNPVQQGAADTLSAAAYPGNRSVDVANAGVAVSAEAISAAVAKSIDASVAPLIAIISELAQALRAKP